MPPVSLLRSPVQQLLHHASQHAELVAAFSSRQGHTGGNTRSPPCSRIHGCERTYMVCIPSCDGARIQCLVALLSQAQEAQQHRPSEAPVRSPEPWQEEEEVAVTQSHHKQTRTMALLEIHANVAAPLRRSAAQQCFLSDQLPGSSRVSRELQSLSSINLSAHPLLSSMEHRLHETVAG